MSLRLQFVFGNGLVCFIQLRVCDSKTSEMSKLKKKKKSFTAKLKEQWVVI